MVPDFPEDSLVNFGGVQSPPMYIISSEGNSAMRSTATATARQHMVLLCEVVNPPLVLPEPKIESRDHSALRIPSAA